MYRPFLAFLLLVAVARPGAAQGTRSAADSVRAAVKSAGFAAGLSVYPASHYCDGSASAAMQPLEPRVLLDRIQLASSCGFRLVIVPPRRMLTTNRKTVGPFSVEDAQRLMDRYAEVLTPDTLRKYRSTILGLNLADDYNCEPCWGGRKITQAEIVTWAEYTRQKLPGLALGVRKTPDWVEAHPRLAPLLDYAWAQYDTKKGDAKEFYDDAATVAGRLGMRVVMGVNVEDCYGGRTRPCSPEDLVKFGTLAIRHPGSCAFISWRYNEATWERPGMREAWEEVLSAAKQRRAADCRRRTDS